MLVRTRKHSRYKDNGKWVWVIYFNFRLLLCPMLIPQGRSKGVCQVHI